jgi:hypothetical protein
MGLLKLRTMAQWSRDWDDDDDDALLMLWQAHRNSKEIAELFNVTAEEIEDRIEALLFESRL